MSTPDDIRKLSPRGQSVGIMSGTTGLRRSRDKSEVFEEFLPTMRGIRQRTDLYHQIAANSPIVSASLYLIRSYLMRAPLEFVASGDKPRHLAAAEFCREAFKPPMVRALVDDATTALTYGFSLVEVALKQDEASGKYVPRKFAPRSPRSVTDWVWDEATDEVVAFVQYSSVTGQYHMVPLSRCMHFRVGRGDADNPEGVALLRGAVSSEYYSRRLTELEAIGSERDLTGLPVIKVPGEMLDPNATTEQKAALATFQALIRDIRRDKSEGIILPSDRDELGHPYFEASLMASSGNRQVNIGQSIERHEKRIAQAFLTGFLFLGLGSGGTGSYALSSDTTNLFKASLTVLQKLFADQIAEKPVTMMWRANGMNPDLMPEVRFGELDKIDLNVLSQVIERLTRSGFVMGDMGTQDVVRDSAGLPPTPRTAEAAAPPPFASITQPAPPVTPAAGGALSQEPVEEPAEEDVDKIVDLTALIARLSA